LNKLENGFNSLFESRFVLVKFRQIFNQLWQKLDALLLDLHGFTIFNEIKDLVDDDFLVFHDDIGTVVFATLV